MEDARFGAVIRAVRIRTSRSQAQVAEAAMVPQSTVSRLERGLLAGLSFGAVRRISTALGMQLELTPRWRGTDLDRLINGAHTALQGSVLQVIEGPSGWIALPEVSYSIFGERGAIDILAWHRASRSVLVVELKTMLVDPAELVRKMDQRRRLAPRIARERGWDTASVSSWVVLTDTRTNRRHASSHSRVLAPLAGIDGRSMRAWLRAPTGAVSALSFWTERRAVILRRVAKSRPRPRAGGMASHAPGNLDEVERGD